MNYFEKYLVYESNFKLFTINSPLISSILQLLSPYLIFECLKIKETYPKSRFN